MPVTDPASPPDIALRRTRRSGAAALGRRVVRQVSWARDAARAQRRTVIVILATAVAAFLVAWWLSPVAAGSAGSLTTVGMAAATTRPTAAPESSGAPSTRAAQGGATGAGRDDSGAAGGASGAAGGASGSTRSLFVHVSGAVAKPGLVEVADGARVFDAVAQAGGVTAEAREGGVNLARFVVDGEQILVPRRDDPAPVTSSAGAAASAAGGGAGSSGVGATGPSGAAGKVNLNTATAAELETLPRVGPSLSAKILAWRAENGPFSAIEDLNDVDGVGDKTFESLKDLVTL